MKRSLSIILTLTVSFMLTACSDNSYGDEIDSVIDLEDEELEKDSVKTDSDTLERNYIEEANVYNNGEYIELIYEIRSNTDPASPVYKYDEDEIDSLEADYTEDNNE